MRGVLSLHRRLRPGSFSPGGSPLNPVSYQTSSSVESNRLTRSRASYIPTLDGWRALAILAVLGYHSPVLSLGPVHFTLLHQYGSQGVDLFFALSGLLICTRLLTEESEAGSISLSNFYWRRIFRILPAAALYLAVLAVLGFSGVIPVPPAAWCAALFFYANYYATFVSAHHLHSMYWYTGHFWSLAIEEHFYLALPGLLVLFPRHRKTVLAGLILFFALWYARFHAGYLFRTDLRIDSLLIPALLAVLLQSPRIRAWFRAWLHPLIALALLVATVVAITRVGGWFEAAKPLLKVCYPLVIVSTLLRPQSWIGRFLELAPLRWIGRISYSLYLWQQLFFPEAFETRGYPAPPWLRALQHLPVNLACVFILAAISYYFVEKPILAAGHRFLDRRRERALTQGSHVRHQDR